MLVLTRRKGEAIILGDNVEVRILGISRHQVKVGIEAPRSVPVLIERIAKRARDYETGIDPGYLERLSEAYSYFFFHYRETPLLVVNTDDIDFIKNPADLDALVQQIIRCQRGTQVYVPLGSSRTER